MPTQPLFCKVCGKEFSGKQDAEVCSGCVNTPLGQKIQGISNDYRDAFHDPQNSNFLYNTISAGTATFLLAWFIYLMTVCPK